MLLELLNHSNDIFAHMLTYISGNNDVRTLVRLRATCRQLTAFLAAKVPHFDPQWPILAHFRRYKAALIDIKSIKRFQIIRNTWVAELHTTFLQNKNKLTIYVNYLEKRYHDMSYIEVKTQRGKYYRTYFMYHLLNGKVTTNCDYMANKYELKFYKGRADNIPEWLLKYFKRSSNIVRRLDVCYENNFTVDKYY
jgi:hypothetical protein